MFKCEIIKLLIFINYFGVIMFKKLLAVLMFAMVGILLTSNLRAQDPPPGCEISGSSGPETIEEFNFNSKAIYYYCDYKTCGGSYYIDAGTSADVEAGSKYSFSGKTGLWYTSYYSHAMRMFVDWNQDGYFDGPNELVWTTGYNYVNTSYSGSMTVPSNIPPGNYLLRMVSGEDPYNEAFDYGCGDMGAYSQSLDFRLKVKSGLDASVTDITNPVSPFAVGPYAVVAKIKNFGSKDLTKMTINWNIKNQNQTPYNWTGNLKSGDEMIVSLGVYSFTYPPEGPFDPFSVRVWTSDLNGSPYDDNPSNNEIKKTLTPFLNDCGAIGFFGPPEGFGPGVTQVRARVRNYAPKPLSSVTINWKIDNVDQTPITITGLNIKEGQYQDLVVGTYTFYNKTPLGPFNVEVTTSKPNGVNDEDTKNDKYAGGIGPSLVAGTYTVGGYSYHFADLATAASYLNSSGVFGKGTVNLEVRPGTYNGQILFNNPPANGNPIVIKSSTGKAYDVVITGNATNKDNYVVQVNGFNYLEFQNVTIQNPNTNFSLAGIVLDISNAMGVKLLNVILNGVANSPKDDVYSVLKTRNASFEMLNSSLSNGSISVNFADDFGYSSANLEKNNFSNFSWSGVKSTSGSGEGSGNADLRIENNIFKWESGNIPNNGIWNNGAVAYINNNTFNGIKGTGDALEGVIKTENTSDYTVITNNIIDVCTNINGIRADNALIFANKNYINITQTLSNMNALVFASMTDGWIGNNMLIGTNIFGMHVHYSKDFNAIYNSFETYGTRPSVHTIDANFNLQRNIFVNNGTGYNYDITGGTPFLMENVHYNAAGTLARVNGTIYNTVADLNNAGIENGSNEAKIEYKTDDDLHILLYTSELLFGYPLFENEYGMGSMIESSDYDNEERTSFYAGVDEIFLRINIARQSDGFIDCENTTDNKLTVSGEINYGAEMFYQWEKDGLPIKGETEPVLYFPKLNFLQSGLYRCLVMGPGTTPPVYSKPVAVYVATPTVITREPENQIIPLGSLATFKFDAHVNGKSIEEALYNYEVKVQWYKYVNESQSTPLKDDNKFAGTKSNYLTIKGFTKTDAGKYYAEVIGICSSAKTKMVDLMEEVLEITIVEQPINNVVCVDEEVIFRTEATTQSTKALEYQWYKDGAVVKDVKDKIEGSQSHHLIIYNIAPADAGEYWAVVNLKDTEVQKSTNKTTLTVNNVPQIITNLTDISIQAGGQGTLEVLLEDMEDPNLKFEWYKDGNKIAGEDLSLLLIEDAKSEDGGEYWCIITNGCGKTTSAKAIVTVTTSGSTDVEEVTRNGYTLRSAVPNPVNSLSVITFTTPTSGNVKITLNGMSGEEIAVLLNTDVNKGENLVKINTNDLKLSSGTYFVKFESNGTVLVQKVTVIK